jgi:ATP-dependent helicase/nuclease subunit B
MASSHPRVFTVPSSAPFLPTLITALVEGRLVPGFHPKDDPLALSTASLYLPTRRACRLARDIFLNVLGQEAALLPRLTAIGDIDEDELIFAEAAGPLGAQALDLPLGLGGLERRLLLAQLVLKWAQSKDVRGVGDTPLVANTPTAALALADALARLIDDMTTRGVAWERLDSLVPDNVDNYWQLTLRFLKIAREHWPALLAERGAVEPAARRDRLIAAEAARLANAQDGPVIAAGSTGSMPATAALLATIARLPNGAVVLPGLDTWLDEPAWGMIAGEPAARAEATGVNAAMPAFGHPQFAMQALLAGLGMMREEVVSLAPPAAHGRDRLVSEALRPAGATERWGETIAHADFGAALGNVAVIEAANAEEEALAIAVALREAIECKRTRCALVTPDRALARRVVAALARWNVAVDDSGGDALADTPAGTFARLAAETALGGLEPVTLLALLKHPLLRLGRAKGGHAVAISVLERALLRGPRPRAGSAGLAQALATFRANRETLHASDRRRALAEHQLDRAARFVEALTAALAPLETTGRAPQPLATLVEGHRRVVAALAAGDDGSLADASGDADALVDALDAIAANDAANGFTIAPRDYPEMLPGLLADSVRRPPNADAQVRIFGLLEARLQPIDRIVLGGLTEGVWPPQTRSDPWLSRPMRHQLGLDLPERRIGLTAHDFAQAMGAKEVILARADKIAGAPTVASRFVRRLAAVAGEARWNEARERGGRYIAWARALDRPAEVAPIKPPEPKPPLSARPIRLSVTEIEHWLRDPYTIYAKHILRLAPLDAVDTPPGARDRGSAIHAAIEQFSKDFAAGLPPDPLAELLRIGRDKFAPLNDYPEARAFWWPRFERIARWLVDWERRRRDHIEAMFAEISGEFVFPLGERTFTLTTRIDRIEQLAPATYALLDYKTGSVATKDQVRSGLAPQLTLEAAIVRQGKLTGVARGEVDAFNYLRLRGGEPAGVECPIAWKDTTPAAEAARALAKLRHVIERFEDVETPYRALTNPMWKSRYGDYDHLARVKEWLDPDTDEWAG